MNTYENISSLNFFNKTLDELTKEVFYTDIGRQYVEEYTKKDIEKTVWASSALAHSQDDEHKKKALETAVLIYLTQKSNDETVYRNYLYTILSRTGSIPSANALAPANDRSIENTVQNNQSSLLSAELGANEEYYTLDDSTILTDFQLRVWEKLSDQYIVFSGPTSSGKSYLMRRYIKHLIDTRDNVQIIYIVPTRALISEVSSKFRESIDSSISIQTDANIDQSVDDFILILTPERCLQLFDYEDDDKIDIDLIFIDEIQKIEDGGRGPLFENVLENLELVWSNAQIVAAGPYIENPSEILSDVIQADTSDIKTIFNPAFQLKARFIFKKRDDKIWIEIQSPSGNVIDTKINRPKGFSYSTIKNNKKKSIQKFIDNFGGESQSLVYSKTQNAAEKVAEGMSDHNVHKNPESEELIELREFIERTIHPKYSLAKTVSNSVAFHHASVPQVLRDEIESLYRKGHLRSIACTSTLLEGVNLPAERMYIIDAKKGRSKDLSNFELQNLIGRVGRVGNSLYGTIYFIDREDDEWSEGRLNEKVEKEVVSATKSAIVSKQDELYSKVATGDTNDIEDPGLRYTIILLRNRYIKDRDSVRPYLIRKGASEDAADDIINKLDEEFKEIEIPEKILRKNPTVDPIAQDLLYQNIQNNTDIWEVSFTNRRDSLMSVTRKLNNIFHFVSDPEERVESNAASETRSRNLNELFYTAYYWLNEENYNFMIQKRVSVFDESTNTAIKNLMKIINTDIRYILVKYYKILCDILKSLDDYDNQFMLNFDKRLERGSYKSERLQLINMGIDRSIALDLDVPKNKDEDEIKESLHSQLSDHSPIFERHLTRTGIID